MSPKTISSTMGGRSEKIAEETETRSGPRQSQDQHTWRGQRHAAAGPGTSRGMLEQWTPKWKRYKCVIVLTFVGFPFLTSTFYSRMEDDIFVYFFQRQL